jgi:CRP/FNR family transcriptional regulator, cyclic AMP receptor protein
MATGLRANAAAEAAVRAADDRGTPGEWLELLGQMPLFDGLSKRHLRRIASVAKTRRFPRGVTIVKAGRPGDAFYVILDGQARVDTGRRGIALGPGDFFGEMALLEDAPRSADVVAVEDVLTLQVGRTAFAKLLRQEPQLGIAMLRTLAGRLRSAQGS